MPNETERILLEMGRNNRWQSPGDYHIPIFTPTGFRYVPGKASQGKVGVKMKKTKIGRVGELRVGATVKYMGQRARITSFSTRTSVLLTATGRIPSGGFSNAKVSVSDIR